MLLAAEKQASVIGHAFNIGGGVTNAVSLVEVLDLIAELHGDAPKLAYAEERTGDQRYYVADTRRFEELTGWRPLVPATEGIGRLYQWLYDQQTTTPRRAVAR
jgi:CDP-paratose 2-epimerase